MNSIPVIDIQSLMPNSADAAQQSVTEQIGRACRESGFFYITGHGVSPALQSRLQELSRRFFAQNQTEKMKIRMALGGRAWRGYFPVGDELTSGRPDQKEGLYFGAELDGSHPKVQAGVPLHGRNLFPAIDGFRDTVLEWMEQMTQLGHSVMRAVALSLGLDSSYFADRLHAKPTRAVPHVSLPTAGRAAEQPLERW